MKLTLKFLLSLIILLLLTIILAFYNIGHPSTEGTNSPNFIFIAVDDLRPEIAAFGASHMKTPTLDQLTYEGRSFTQHYVQVPSCGPSRFSMLTGLVPTSRAHTANNDVFKDELENSTVQYESFPHLLRENGYTTISIGKVSHHPGGKTSANEESNGYTEMPQSWDNTWAPIAEWGSSWKEFKTLKANNPMCATLYQPNGFDFTNKENFSRPEGMQQTVDYFRNKLRS